MDPPTRRQLEQDLDLDAAAARVLRTRPFGDELDHLGRYPNQDLLLRVLKAAAVPNATRLSIETAVPAGAGDLDDALKHLQAEFYLYDDASFVLPLLAEWLRQ